MKLRISLLTLFLVAGLSAQEIISGGSGGGGASSGGSPDRLSFDMATVVFPDTDGASFSWAGTELRYPVTLLSIGDEAQYRAYVTSTIGTDLKCGIAWSFAAGGPTTNNVSFECSLSCVSDGEEVISQAFDTANASGDIVVPGTATLDSHDTWAVTNSDSCVKGDTLVLQLERTTPSGTSAGTNDVRVRAVWLEWTN